MVTLVCVETYPKEIMLSDGTEDELRYLEEGDKVRSLCFFERISETDRYYLKENVTSPEVILDWTANKDLERVISIVALVDGEIVADATLHRRRSQIQRHLGELRLVVDPESRERGLGAGLLKSCWTLLEVWASSR